MIERTNGIGIAVMVDGEAPLTIRSTGDALSLYKKSFTGAFFASFVREHAAVLVLHPVKNQTYGCLIHAIASLKFLADATASPSKFCLALTRIHLPIKFDFQPDVVLEVMQTLLKKLTDADKQACLKEATESTDWVYDTANLRR